MKNEFFACRARKVMTEKDLEIYRTEVSDMEVRNSLIVQSRNKGVTLREIGRQYSLSAERIRGICARHQRDLSKESKRLIPLKQFLEMVTVGLDGGHGPA